MKAEARKLALLLFIPFILGALFVVCSPFVSVYMSGMGTEMDAVGMMPVECCLVRPFEIPPAFTNHIVFESTRNLLFTILAIGAFITALSTRRISSVTQEPSPPYFRLQYLFPFLPPDGFKTAIYRGIVHPRIYESVIAHS